MLNFPPKLRFKPTSPYLTRIKKSHGYDLSIFRILSIFKGKRSDLQDFHPNTDVKLRVKGFKKYLLPPIKETLKVLLLLFERILFFRVYF